MSDKPKPITDLVRQGWEISGYSVCDLGGSAYCHSVMLTRGELHKVVVIRKKIIGDGIVIEELDV